MSKLEHGKHNLRVCNHLNLQSEILCNDWIVTTAFYASIHYIDHILFPCSHKIGDSEYVFNNINEAHNFLQRRSKHQSRATLVNLHLPALSIPYKFLLDESQEARYSNYLPNPLTAQRAIRELKKITDKSETVNIEKKK
jgi:hypothetical protein